MNGKICQQDAMMMTHYPSILTDGGDEAERIRSIGVSKISWLKGEASR